jgi:hypothetical protein
LTYAGAIRASRVGVSFSSSLIAYALFIVVVPLVAHWRFSRFGFNPTDDGFVLAVSRRLLAGEIPHRDFISIHTIGSSILHLPFVLFGGDHVFMASRLFVWFELAATALIWTLLIGRLVGGARDPLTEILIATIAFTLSAHYFPVMAWPTIDGLLLAGLGLLLRTAPFRWACFAGYALIGTAYVCKQNFSPIFPLALLLFGDWRRWSAWIAGILPALIYVALLAAAGGLGDAYIQLGSETDLMLVGVRKFLWEYATPWGVLSGYVAMRALYRPGPRAGFSWDGTVACLLVLLAIGAACQAMAEGRFLGAPSFGLFGMALGAALHCCLEDKSIRGRGAAGLLAVAIAWCASVSIGYNTPALASGICAAYLLWLVRAAPVWHRWVPRPLYPLLAVYALFCFNIARESFVYLDRPATELTYSLEGVLPGGAGLFTNRNTYDFMADLNQAIGKAGGGPYAVLPDLAGHWVKATQPNPLPTDWPNWIELGRPALLARVTDRMDAERPGMTFIVQKIDAFSLGRGLVPLADGGRYPVTAYVRRNYTKVDETRFFELHR